MTEQSIVLAALTFIGGTLFKNILDLFKTRNEKQGTNRDDDRDDFSVITAKLKEIIDRQDAQLMGAEKRVDEMVREQQQMKKRLVAAHKLNRQLHEILNEIELDAETRRKIDELHKQIVVDGSDIID